MCVASSRPRTSSRTGAGLCGCRHCYERSEPRRHLATLWRVESPRVLARLARFVGHLDTAEELTQDTFVAAIEKWRQDGVPDNPAAWLHTTARYLTVDRIRRRDTHRNKVRLVAATSPQVVEAELTELVGGDLADDLLGLIFMAAHPILSPDARSALTLKLVCGLAADIARAFLVPGPTIAQRVVRAKRTLAAANIRFEPGAAERPARLAAVREVIYLVFNEGYSATQRGLLDTHRSVRGGAAAGPHAGQPDAPRPQAAGSAGTDGAPSLPDEGPHRTGR
jgi:predicted RNA polymerase sigma factor